VNEVNFNNKQQNLNTTRSKIQQIISEVCSINIKDKIINIEIQDFISEKRFFDIVNQISFERDLLILI
jgi:hypothetical protein